MTSSGTSNQFEALIAGFSSKRVLVMGDAMLDEYVLGDCSRISPEAPVPILRISSTRHVLGGAANTAANIASLGGHSTLIALVGNDEGGQTLRRCASEAGVNLLTVDHGLKTLRKTRVVGQQQQIVRLDYEEIPVSTPAIESEILSLFDACIEDCDIVVISDYAKGFLAPSLAQTIIQRAHEAGRRVIVDPRPQHRECYLGCDYITPNWKEARALLRLPDAEYSPSSAIDVASALAADIGGNVVLTLGPHGILFCGSNGAEQFAMPTLAREVFDVSGAGDTVVAAFALACASGADHTSAVSVANKAASVVVGKAGTATVTVDELVRDADAPRLIARYALAELATALRAKGKQIVTINGSFDILHNGHLYILSEARKQGDVLIVGLNSDASVKTYKGPGRPVVSERQRAELLLSLRVVDYVHIFDETDPIAFLTEVRPDVHVNGSEYGADCIESETVRRGGGTIHIVSRIPGLSTSGLIDALQSNLVVKS